MPEDNTATFKLILVGMTASTVFGFLDNAGMFFGSNYLDEVFQTLPYSQDANVFAGYGNTYSDFVGAFLGTFCGLIINDLCESDSTPIWAQAIGVFQGCLLGILIPKMILGNSSNERGVNKSLAMSGNLIGNVDQSAIKDMLTNEPQAIEYYADKMFTTIDKNNDGIHTILEVREYLNEIGCVNDDIQKFLEKNYKNCEVDIKKFRMIFKELCSNNLQGKKVANMVNSKVGKKLD